jgi:hypothetical protein
MIDADAAIVFKRLAKVVPKRELTFFIGVQ